MSKVSFTLLLQKIQPLLDKDRAVQLDSLLIRFKNNEISTEDLLQRTRSIVGDHLFKSAMYMLQIQAARDSLTASSQLLSLPQASVQQMSPNGTQIPADLSKSDEVENQADFLPVQDLIDQTNEKHNKAEISSAQRLFPSSSAQMLFPSSSAQIKQGNAAPGNLKDEYSSMQSSRMGVMPLPRPTATSISSKSSMPSLTSSIGPGTTSKSPKPPFVVKKKPTEARNFSSPPSSKKQKLSGAFLHHSIGQLNDVSKLSGIDIREEEEHLVAGLKKDSLVSDASRRVGQEEEHIFFHKIPLQKRLMETIARHGLKRTSNDVEHCLSLCMEERMRDLVSNLIRLSKKRIDVKKTSRRTVITSDVKQQVMEINHKAHEERERKQAKTEKSKEPESTTGVDGDKKNESCARSAKGTKAANVAIRAATGVADMMSKWQLMVEAKQKQGGIDKSYDSHQLRKNDKDATNPSNRDGSEAFDTPALVGKVGQHQVVVPQVTRRITVKDVIAVLERDPQLSKSTLIYTLYNKVFAGGGE